MRVVNKSITSVFKQATSKIGWKGVLLLSGIIIVVLAISILYPFHRFTEGLETSETATIKKALDEYTNNIEKVSKDGIDRVSSIKGLSQVDAISISPIIDDVSGKMTNAYKVSQLIGMNSSNVDLLKILNDVQGQQYSALLTMLQALPEDSKDKGFAGIVKQHRKAPIIGSDMNSTFGMISKYVENAAIMQAT
jgi:hypothetical protein